MFFFLVCFFLGGGGGNTGGLSFWFPLKPTPKKGYPQTIDRPTSVRKAISRPLLGLHDSSQKNQHHVSKLLDANQDLAPLFPFPSVTHTDQKWVAKDFGTTTNLTQFQWQYLRPQPQPGNEKCKMKACISLGGLSPHVALAWLVSFPLLKQLLNSTHPSFQIRRGPNEKKINPNLLPKQQKQVYLFAQPHPLPLIHPSHLTCVLNLLSE